MAKLVRLQKPGGGYALARKSGKLVTDAGGAPCCCGGCGGSCSSAPICATTDEPGICWNSELDWGRQQTLRIQLTQANFTRNRGGRNLYCNMTSPGSVDLKIGWKNDLWGVCDVQNETPPEWSIYFEEFLGAGQWNFGGVGTHTSQHFGADMALSMGFYPFGIGQTTGLPLNEWPDVVCPFWPNLFASNDQWPIEAQRFMIDRLNLSPSASMAMKGGERLAVSRLSRPTQRVRTLVQSNPPIFQNIFHCQRTFDNEIQDNAGDHTQGSLNNWMAAGIAYRDLVTGEVRGDQVFLGDWSVGFGEQHSVGTQPIHSTTQQAHLGDGSTSVSRSSSSTGASVNYTSTHTTTNQSGSTVLDSTGGFSFSLTLIDSVPCDPPASAPLPPHLDEFGRPKKQPGQCAGCGE